MNGAVLWFCLFMLKLRHFAVHWPSVLHRDDRFNPEVDRETGFCTRSIIAVPVFHNSESGTVIGVIELLNKKNGDGTDGYFDLNDAKLLTMLSCHVSQFIRIVGGGG
jgi:hypothetical protein